MIPREIVHGHALSTANGTNDARQHDRYLTGRCGNEQVNIFPDAEEHGRPGPRAPHEMTRFDAGTDAAGVGVVSLGVGLLMT